jgi:hypothetical protein
MGLRAHYMGGINPEAVAKTVGAKDQDVICVIAIGKQGTLENQSAELVEREQLERTRKEAGEVYSIDSKAN